MTIWPSGRKRLHRNVSLVRNILPPFLEWKIKRQSMPDEYPLSTSQIVQITIKELAKDIPVLGRLVSAHSAVFNKIEQNRVKAFLTDLVGRVQNLEATFANMRNAEIALFACDVIRGDPLTGEKSATYAGVVASLFDPNKGDMDAVVEILDNLRKLNLSDLKILYRFKKAAADKLPMGGVADLQPGYTTRMRR